MKNVLWSEAQKIIETNLEKNIYLWFGTEWCGDCHMMLPIIKKIIKEYENDNNLIFIKVDAEEAQIFRKETKWKVLKVPAHIFIKKGNIQSIMYEYISYEKIKEEIEKMK